MHAAKASIVVRPGDCFDHWHQVTCRDFSLTECRRIARERFRARISIRPFGPLMVNDIWSSTAPTESIEVFRSPADIRKDPRDYFMLWLTIGGEVVFEQNGRAARMRSSDLVLHDQSQPFTLAFSERARSIMISIPRPLLISRLPDAPRLTARRIAGGSKLGSLAGSIIRRLMQLDGGIGDGAVRQIGASTLDILTTTLESELTSDAGPRHGEERLARVKRYLLSNLHDPSLDLDAIAAAQNIAPRTLNRLFAQEGTTPIRWLWHQRLTASYTALAEGRVLRVTDAALNFGFSDLSHFSRAFKAAFGVSPHAVRERGTPRA